MDAPLAVLLRDKLHETATVRLALKVEQFSINFTKQPIQVPVPRQSPIILELGSVRPAITISGVIDNVGQDRSNKTAGFEHMEKFVVQGQNYYVPYKNFLENKLTTWVSGTGIDLQIEIGDASVREGDHASMMPNDYAGTTDGPGYYPADTLTAAMPDEGGTNDTHVVVNDTTNFYVGQHIAIINSSGNTSNYEIMKVQSLSNATTLIVARDQKGTPSETHAQGATVFSIGISPGAPATGGGIYDVAVSQAQFSVAPAMEDRWMYSISFVAKMRDGIRF